jgi:hypothetical protein
MIQRLPELPEFPASPAQGDQVFLTAFDAAFPTKQPDQPYVWISNDFAFHTGDGVTNPWLSPPDLPIPVTPRTVVVKVGGVEAGRDDGAGNLVSSGTASNPVSVGTVNYGTGVLSITFSVPVAAGVPITVGIADWVLLLVPTPVTDALRSVDFPNRVRFTGRDFQTIEDELRAALAEQFGDSFNDFLLSDLGVMFIQAVAWAADNLAFYQDQQATEVYLDTAQLVNNVIRLVRNLGFKVRGAVPSTVDLRITLNQTYAFPVTFPAGFQFIAGDVVFETLAPLTIPAGALFSGLSVNDSTVGAVQGETTVETFITAATPNQIFQLLQVPTGKNVAENVSASPILSVSVDGTTWAAPPLGPFANDPLASDPPGGEVSFLQLRPAHIYEVERAKDPAEVRFGDGVAGLIPMPVGAEVKVTYKATLGLQGNVSIGTINAARFPLVVAGQVINHTVTNIAVSSGGLDPQTADEVRPLARGVFASAGRAVSEEDYDAHANNYPGVGIAKALLIRGIEDDVLLLNLLDQVGTLLDNPTPPSGHMPPYPTPLVAASVKSSLTTLLDDIISSLCKSNHVEILTLAKDTNGDYIAPTSVLLDGLQTAIRNISIFPVTVQAVDASPQLVPTAILAEVQFDPSADKVALTQEIGDVLVARLRGRQLGEALRLSDLYDDTDLDGITFRNITIRVPAATLPLGALPSGSVFLNDLFNAADVVLGRETFVVSRALTPVASVTVTDLDTSTSTTFP